MAHEAAHAAVVDQHHGRIGTSAHALSGLHGEHAIGRGAAHFRTQLVAQVCKRLAAIAQLARQVGALSAKIEDSEAVLR